MKRIELLGALILGAVGCSGEDETAFEPELSPMERVLADNEHLRDDPEALMAVIRNDSDVLAQHDREQWEIPVVDEPEPELELGTCELTHALVMDPTGSVDKAFTHLESTRCAPGTELEGMDPRDKQLNFNYSGLKHSFLAHNYNSATAGQFAVMAMGQLHRYYDHLTFTARPPGDRTGGFIHLTWQKSTLGMTSDGRLIIGLFVVTTTSTRVFQSARIRYDMANLASWVSVTPGATTLDAEAILNLHELGHFMSLGDLNFAAPFPPQYSTVMNYQANNCIPSCMASWHYSPEEHRTIEQVAWKNLPLN